jgi:predicted RNA-binding Zn-ribbon protein involved in translation (DUF1610 family)
MAWLWYADTYPMVHERIYVLETYLNSNPESQRVKQACDMLKQTSGNDNNSILVQNLRNNFEYKNPTPTEQSIQASFNLNDTPSTEPTVWNQPNNPKSFSNSTGAAANKLQCPNCKGYKISTSGLTVGWIIAHIVLTILTSGLWLVGVFIYILVARKPQGKYRCKTCGFEWGAFG